MMETEGVGRMEAEGNGRGYLAERGWRSWAFTLDHKRIGAMYLWTTTVFFLIGGVFALLLRLELLSPQAHYFSNHTYNIFFTLHGSMRVFLFGMSSILTGLNFIVTIHKMRAPGMTWHRMPLFLWAMYATSIIQVIATPVVGVTFLLLAAERVLGVGFFDPAKGGDPVLFQHFFWFYSHPVVYVMILPAMGIVSEVIPVFSRKPIFGYKAIAYSSLAIAFIGFLVWGHHMFTSGMSATANAIFSFLTFFVAVPTAVKVFNWIATLYRGSITFESPMLYALT